MRTIYFDYNATTPLDRGVGEAMARCASEVFGNPSSQHRYGREARTLLDDCRQGIADLLRCKPSELVFTSGGTESNNLAILSLARLRSPHGRHLITTAIEHHSVLNCFQYLQRVEGFDLTILPVDTEGVVAPESLRQALRPNTILVSIMAANNETGAFQPIPVLSALCREVGVAFHVDASQVFGKQRVTSIHDFQADLVTLCGHKFHGPKGAGLLFVRSPLRLPSLLQGGAQEEERRPGTENLPMIVGLRKALEINHAEPVFPEAKLRPLIALLATLPDRVQGVSTVSASARRLPNTISFTIDDCDNMLSIAALDLEGICVSGGSACSTGALIASHVLLAMGRSSAEAKSFLRFSLGRDNTLDEVQHVLSVIPMVVERIRDANNLRIHREGPARNLGMATDSGSSGSNP